MLLWGVINGLRTHSATCLTGTTHLRVHARIRRGVWCMTGISTWPPAYETGPIFSTLSSPANGPTPRARPS